MARAVNLVWNFCNDTQKHALRWSKKWPSAFDLVNLTSGSSKEIGLSAESINAVCLQYAASRRQFKRPYLRYRGKRSLGWIPVKGRALQNNAGVFTFFSKQYQVWYSRPIPENAIIKDRSSFSQDAKGNWFINVVLDIPDVEKQPASKTVGIDLGLKSFAALSTGEVIEADREYRRCEEMLGKAQRARKKKRVRSIHAKIKNRRQDTLHKLSNRLSKEFGFIAVGDISSSKLTKTKMAKSVNDAGWHSFKTMLAYKCDRAGAIYIEVNEAYTTRACSSCGVISDNSPKGMGMLGIREWTCECGVTHDRDVNAAKNILAAGHRRLAEEMCEKGKVPTPCSDCIPIAFPLNPTQAGQ